ncbi:ribonuclease H-like domain-containing protein [Tanacetum coccineum]
MTEDQRKRQQEVLASAVNYSDAAWDIILARLQANPDLSSTIFGFMDDDFAAKMVTLVNSRRKELAEQRAQERRDRPMTPAQLRKYMRTYVKNQEEFDKIQRAVAFTRGLKRDGSPMTTSFSKKLKTGDVEVDVEAPSHGVPQEVEVEAPSQDVSREKVDVYSQNILEAPVEVPSQEASVEDVEVPSNIASKAQQTASSLKKVGTKKKLLGRKGVHTSQSTIPIEEGDPDAEHKLCIKYASDEDSASDCDTPVHLYVVVDWELLLRGLVSINSQSYNNDSQAFFTALGQSFTGSLSRIDVRFIGDVMTFYQDKKAEGVGLVLWGDLKILMDSPEVNDGSDFWKNQHTWSIQNWKLYSFSGVHVLEIVSGLVIHMFVDKKYPLTINLIERMLAEVVPKSVAGSVFPAASSTLLLFDVQICAEVSCVQVKTQADCDVAVHSYFNPQVPTGRVVVPLQAVKIYLEWDLISGSDNESDDASVHNEATIPQQQRNIQPQIITTVSNNNAKFPYLKKDEYEVWAMKMEYWITNNDMNIWKVIQNGNSLKRTGRDRDGRVILFPPTIADEHIAVQRESKARTTLLQSIPDDHVADFHYMNDARDIWNAVKARISEAEGLHKGYDRMQKILSQLNQLKAKPEDEDINLKFLIALPSSWSQVQSILHLLVPPVLAKDYPYPDSPSYTSSTYTVPSNSKTGSHRSGNVIEDVLQSFVLINGAEQQLAYEDFDQIEKLDLEEMDLKWQMAMLSVRVHKFEQKAGRKIDFDKKESARFNKKKVRCYKCLQRGHFARECRTKGGNDKQRYSSFKIQEIGKKEEDSKALITVDTLVDWTEHDGQSDGVIAPKEFGMIAGCDTEDAIEEETAKEEQVEGRPLFNRFAKTDSMKVVPPPLSGDYTPLSDHIDLDESQIDKSSEVNTNDFASSDSSVKSSEPKSNDSTSCASTSSVSTSESEAEIESNVGTPIQEPIIVQDYLHLIKDSNYYETQYPNDFDGVGYPQREPIWDYSTRVTQSNQFVPQAVLLRSGKVSIPTARPNQVPAGRPKPVSTGRPKPISTGKQNRPSPVHAGRINSSSVTSGWWQSTARPMTHLPSPTSSYFQTYRPYVPQMYYNHMPYGGENSYTDAEDEGIFDSGCSRSMTGNMERLDDFQEFQGGKVTFGGGEGRITGKGTIRTPTLDFENVYYVKGPATFLLDFMLLDESMVLLRVPRKHNLYTINLNNLSPKGNLACLVAKALVEIVQCA